jgi:hypothetical protein
VKYFISLSTGLASRWQIGDEVSLYFGNVEGIGVYTNIPVANFRQAQRCRVVAVKFEGGKVLYDLEVWMTELDENGVVVGGEWYEAHPLIGVDSYFVHDINQLDLIKKNMENPNYRKAVGR